jgi:uncharacterized membrane protein
MGKFLENLYRALALGILLMLVAIYVLHGRALGEESQLQTWSNFFVMYLHIFAGILWIGLLYYFNFVQIPTMPKVPAELKPGVSKYIAPAALFWFRWAALFTVILGLGTAQMKEADKGGIVGVLSFGENAVVIGVGMWLAIIMAANVWFVIWPNQKRALGIVPADDASKAKSGRVAMIASRINTVLSIPMLYCMVMQGSAL